MSILLLILPKEKTFIAPNIHEDSKNMIEWLF